MREIVVLEEAAEDIERGREFYNRQDIGVGDYFEDTILSDIESLRLFHGIHSKHFGFHRILSKRFPFGIYYREASESTQVFAVLDLRRNPIRIRKELKGRNEKLTC
jgi:hypothetical protein